MKKLVVKQIRSTKRHQCQSVDKCQELATDCLEVTGEKKIYLCEKHIAQFLLYVANSYLKQGE